MEGSKNYLVSLPLPSLTMNRAISSKTGKKPSLPLAQAATPPTACLKAAQRKKQSPRSPLQALNGICSSSNSSETSSVSIEAPRGCLRFLLSQSSYAKTPVHKSKNLSRTPISAPNVLPLRPSKSSKENLPKGTIKEHPKRIMTEKKFKKNPSCLYQWQSGKKFSSGIGQKYNKPSSVLNTNGNFLPKLSSGFDELKQQKNSSERIIDGGSEPDKLKPCGNDANLTPLSKMGTGSALDVTVDSDVGENSNKTPPIQASVSPEIQCGSSLVSTTTPACYGAGYVVSGVSDKRKCRPRGILTVEEIDLGLEKTTAFDSFDDDYDFAKVTGLDFNPDASLVPLPNEASMTWLSSSFNKGNDDPREKFGNGTCRLQALADSTTCNSVSSPSSGHKVSSIVSDKSDLTNAAKGISRKGIASSISPCGLPEFEGFLEPISSSFQIPTLLSPNSTPVCKAGSSKEGRKLNYGLLDGDSPFSLNSVGGSGNVIRTPQSDSSSDLHVGLSCAQADNLKRHNFNSEMNLMGEVLQYVSLSPNSHFPVEDSASLSFHLTSPCDSIDISHLPKNLEDRDSWLSSSTVGNVSQSNIRISWREGLMSRIYEMDEFDCCRCFSDEDEDVNDCSSEKLPPYHRGPPVDIELGSAKKQNNDSGTTGFDDNEQAIDEKGKDKSPPLVSNSCAESISTDGGGLVASRDDSDWSLCYKNQLFDV